MYCFGSFFLLTSQHLLIFSSRRILSAHSFIRLPFCKVSVSNFGPLQSRHLLLWCLTRLFSDRTIYLFPMKTVRVGTIFCLIFIAEMFQFNIQKFICSLPFFIIWIAAEKCIGHATSAIVDCRSWYVTLTFVLETLKVPFPQIYSHFIKRILHLWNMTSAVKSS